MGEEWRRKSNREKDLETADRERSEREKKYNGHGNHDQLTHDDSDTEKRTITKCYLTLF